jgi:hypothetical protein
LAVAVAVAGLTRRFVTVQHPSTVRLPGAAPVIKRISLAIGLGLAAGQLAAQSAVTLAKPDAAFPEPFTRIRGLKEFPNGRVLTADLQDKVVQLIDFAKGTATKVGREGQGPGEYGLPGPLYALPNGQVWLQDILNRRFLPIDQEGKTGALVTMPTTPGAGPMGIAFGFGTGGSDGQGRLYFQAPPISLVDGRPQAVDSTAILRWDRVRPTLDTVAYLRRPKGSSSASGGNGRFQMRIGGGKVFTPEESWGVAADGSVARVIPVPYQIVWYPAGGKPVVGPTVPYTPIQVTSADKTEVIEQQKRIRPVMIAVGPGGRQAAPPPNIQAPQPEFEDTKPPFTGPESVLVTPEGEAWILRTRPSSDKVPHYDVFDRTGKIVRKVNLNPKSRVIGFGKGTVYVVRVDEEDLEYLERYRR